MSLHVQQGFHLAAQLFIAGTGLIEESRALAGFLFKRCFQQPVNLLPTFRFHKAPDERSILISRGREEIYDDLGHFQVVSICGEQVQAVLHG